MADPISSPDGKWLWTGSEWIPAPPTSAPAADSNINLEDSMVSGNVNLEQNSSQASSVVNLKDSAMSGDINIIQNDAQDIASAMMFALKESGFRPESKPPSSTEIDERKIESILQMSEQLVSKGIEIDPFVELNLGEASLLINDHQASKEHGKRALATFRRKENLGGAALALKLIGNAELGLGNLLNSQKCQLQSFELYKAIGDKEGQWRTMNNLANVAIREENKSETHRLLIAGLRIAEDIDDHEGMGVFKFRMATLFGESPEEQNTLLTEAIEHSTKAEDYEVASSAIFARVDLLTVMTKGKEVDFDQLELGLEMARKSKNINILLPCLNQMSASYYNNGMSDKAIHLANEILMLSAQRNLKPLFPAYKILASSYLDKNEQLDLAEKYCHLILEELNSTYGSEKIQSRLIEEHRLFALNILGRFQAEHDNFDESLVYFERGLDAAKKAKLPSQIRRFLLNIADLYEDKNQLGDCERYLRELLAFYETGPKLWDYKLETLIRLSLIAQKRGNISDNREVLVRCLELVKKIGDPLREANILANLALNAHLRNDHDERENFEALAINIWHERGLDIPGWYLEAGLFKQRPQSRISSPSSETESIPGIVERVLPEVWQVNHRVDDDGTEWAEDQLGTWYYRQSGASDWSIWTD